MCFFGRKVAATAALQQSKIKNQKSKNPWNRLFSGNESLGTAKLLDETSWTDGQLEIHNLPGHAGVPHWFKDVSGPLLYYVVKVTK